MFQPKASSVNRALGGVLAATLCLCFSPAALAIDPLPNVVRKVEVVRGESVETDAQIVLIYTRAHKTDPSKIDYLILNRETKELLPIGPTIQSPEMLDVTVSKLTVHDEDFISIKRGFEKVFSGRGVSVKAVVRISPGDQIKPGPHVVKISLPLVRAFAEAQMAKLEQGWTSNAGADYEFMFEVHVWESQKEKEDVTRKREEEQRKMFELERKGKGGDDEKGGFPQNKAANGQPTNLVPIILGAIALALLIAFVVLASLTSFGQAVYYVGAIIWVGGLLLIIGNITRLFPTFPYAGFLVTGVGVVIQFIGNAIVKQSNEKILAQLMDELARQTTAEDGNASAAQGDERILCQECGFRYLALVGSCPKCNPKR